MFLFSLCSFFSNYEKKIFKNDTKEKVHYASVKTEEDKNLAEYCTAAVASLSYMPLGLFCQR